ncbi:DUF5682 family protein [Arcicella sp. DC2W]|uniref:DUF5682 family protein n=1 Tax=Arcicella gelida TaxID=2984195 RepID=A0ABU5S549_9BACT|nr:DUF5682 family protein [Arcicella sp. DC2W]MEA5403582.1 DUF5682 family protein [Arcicella sp. DC2W]
MPLTILGIRHHGVGSAKNVAERLEQLRPDMILIEGPPEISTALAQIGHPDLKPPVSVMIYNTENPRQSSFYPFAAYSPEWVAAVYANKNNIPLRAMDLPAAIGFQIDNLKQEEAQAITEQINETEEANVPDIPHKVSPRDPLSYLAEVSGFSSGEAFWEHHFEKNYLKDAEIEHFEAVVLAMCSLREQGILSSLDEENVYREAYMREIIRKAQNELFSNIVVICGAWHAPVLQELDKSAKADTKILKALPKTKIKVLATWIPWTNQRLSIQSGYGAGIYSPGWFEHLWQTPQEYDLHWLTKVAAIFRNKNVDISTAHIIEAVRLAESLAALRNSPKVSLDELNEAVLAVMCMGDAIMLNLVREELIIGKKLGKVPSDIPKVPLQEDFERTIKSLRLPLTANAKQYDLDLRNENDLKRSVFLHRLEILQITWAKRIGSNSKGTFKESWKLEWEPEMMISLIDKAFFGNTIQLATQQTILYQLVDETSVGKVSELIQKTIPAELFDIIEKLLQKVNDLATISADIMDLMFAYPPLVQVSRYGNVRKTDLSMIQGIVESLITKIAIGLPNACYGLDEANAEKMFQKIGQVNEAVQLSDKPEIDQLWMDALSKLLAKSGVNQLIKGCTCRLLLDAQYLSEEETDKQLYYSLSVNNDPIEVAAWVEGFLKGSGMILIYDHKLWNLIYRWVAQIQEDVFMELLPILRRTFSKFEYAERRQIGEKAKEGIITDDYSSTSNTAEELDEKRAAMVLPVLEMLMGI